ncbi:response regulator [Microbacterium sp. NPDC057944]|uniref:response regulator n=1 Tax=Microbacterium sp. NPDC057944 TaxID=3346286 RepID=UPI0036DEAA9C
MGAGIDEHGSVIRIGVVDDHRSILVGIAVMLNAREGVHVVAVGRTVAELLSVSQRIDVVLLDLLLSDGSPSARNIAALAATGARVLVFTDRSSAGAHREAMRAGAVGTIRKTDDVTQIVSRLRAAARGRSKAASDAASDVRRTSGVIVALSARETEVLALYAAGATAESAANQLFVTRETVLDHIRRIRAKYANAGRPAVTKVDLFRRAVEDGILEPGD